AVYDQELNLDRFGSLIDPKGVDKVDITPRLGGCAVEPLEIEAHVRSQVVLVELQCLVEVSVHNVS
ncbi:hypothetical protein A2U01_0091094, partial [Trifolium medium]|nr:hypothetical protein [Trifolium medium]